MKIVPNYGNSAFVVPGSATEHLTTADRAALACLLYVMNKQDFSVTSAAEELRMDEEDFISALRFWEEAGVIESKGRSKRSKASAKSTESNDVRPAKPQKKHVASSLPSYSTAETAKFLEDNAKTAELIISCENIIGKIFTTAETNIIIGMLDHLSLSGDYILLLFAHAAKIEKKSVRYIEKLALSFVDRDITKYSELEAELANIELAENTVHHVRSLFGIGSRALTPKEKKMISTWCITWSFTDEIITKAYEITVNATGDASLSYANAVLENWYNAGLKTPEEIDSYSAEYDKTKKGASRYGKKGSAKNTFGPENSSFDTDDFFEAALRRSFDEAGKKPE